MYVVKRQKPSLLDLSSLLLLLSGSYRSYLGRNSYIWAFSEDMSALEGR